MLVHLNVPLDQKELIPESQFGYRKRQSDNRHDLHSKTASGEMPRTECRSIHDVRLSLMRKKERPSLFLE